MPYCLSKHITGFQGLASIPFRDCAFFLMSRLAEHLWYFQFGPILSPTTLNGIFYTTFLCRSCYFQSFLYHVCFAGPAESQGTAEGHTLILALTELLAPGKESLAFLTPSLPARNPTLPDPGASGS